MRKLQMIDGIGPFFRHYDKKRINWSKIPFADIETDDGLKAEVLKSIPDDFLTFVQRTNALGYNAITLDDVAHLVPCDQYPENLQRKISAYRELFGRLMQIAVEHGMQVFLTMDVMFFHESVRPLIKGNRDLANGWLEGNLDQLFRDFPLIAGVIMRFGESDGVDVKGDFRSELWLRRPMDAKQLLHQLIPVFEAHKRKLIFRTWSVGAHPIGDLNWNPTRFDQTFGDIDSEALIISLKYGESDFFRYLPVNPLFFQSRHQKIIEFQARREYEGFGAYPSFIGWDSAKIMDDLKPAENVVGMSVWCQTGGWGKRRQLTYLRNSSLWVELNTLALARIWQGRDVHDVIEEFRDCYLPDVSPEAFLDFLTRSEVVIKRLLYVAEMADQQLYFRRLRLPPQLFVYWDRIMIDPIIKKVLAVFVRDRARALNEGREALEDLREMIDVAKENGIPTRGLSFQFATFEIIAMAREYYFDGDNEAPQKLSQMKEEYKRRFRRNYSVIIKLGESRVHRVPLRWILKLMLRDRSRYRMVDQVITIRLLWLLHPLARKFRHRIGPKFASKQAMGIETLLK
ncbi:MAG: hypothetical protein ACF8CQ_02745 [Rhodopirellula sp. JB044]|uniref:hypothetical protein n=1 Tax=Rhodopirellula sp. JB044 TaxID=3342844 RepID=UPI00370BBE98